MASIPTYDQCMDMYHEAISNDTREHSEHTITADYLELIRVSPPSFTKTDLLNKKPLIMEYPMMCGKTMLIFNVQRPSEEPIVLPYELRTVIQFHRDQDLSRLLMRHQSRGFNRLRYENDAKRISKKWYEISKFYAIEYQRYKEMQK